MGLIVRSRALDALRKRTADRAGVTEELDELLADTLEGDRALLANTSDVLIPHGSPQHQRGL